MLAWCRQLHSVLTRKHPWRELFSAARDLLLVLQGALRSEQDVKSSAAAGQGNAAAVHCCFGLQKHARRTVLAFAVRLLAGVAVKAVKADADHGGRFCCHRGWWQRGGRAGHGACTMVAWVESARHSFPRNDTDQASPFAVTWLITLY